MSDSKAKMHQNRFRLGLPQIPLQEVTSSSSPRLIEGFKGTYFLGEGKELREVGRERKRGENGKEMGRE